MSLLSMTRGETAIFDTTVTNLTSIGLAGYAAWFTAKRDPGDADTVAIFQKTIASSGVVITTVGGTGVPGVLSTTLAPGDTEVLATGVTVKLFYDVKVKGPDGTETTVDAGTLQVAADVTHAI